MIIARVTGTLTSSDKNVDLASYKLLLVQPLTLNREPHGEEEIAIDRVDAGIGDLVLVAQEGNAARQVTGRERIPLQNMVIGVVDDIDWVGEQRAERGSPEQEGSSD